MTNTENFSLKWLNNGSEKSDTQIFWLELLHDVLEVDNPSDVITFEKRVELGHVSFIDAYIPATRTIIEQKSPDVNPELPAKQSDGSVLTPFEQAKRYSDWLPDSEHARWIVICNFQQFYIYDMERPKSQPEILFLKDIERERAKFSFLVDTSASSPKDIRELEVSIKAGELVGKLYDALLERYINPNDKASQRSLNIFCVRVVFLLYAEDAGLFVKYQFHDYLKSRENFAREALRTLFSVLNQEERDPYLDDDLKNFPYVNGGLFEEDNIELPQIEGEPLRIILEDMSESFDWSKISPTIFGAVFESTLNPETRHTGGMHYTSIENIHKLIDPLFMDELNAEFEAITGGTSPKPDAEQKRDIESAANTRTLKAGALETEALNTATLKPGSGRNKTGKSSRQQVEVHKNLRAFQKRLAQLTFFDPACGSGNFLTETFLSLRRLENKIIAELTKGQVSFAFSQQETPVQISISQFYGIEINDFAVAVAKTALWIAEAQMMSETKAIVQVFDDILPLKSYNNIIEANALRIDWAEILPAEHGQLYIMGNPPFLGYSTQTKAQKQDMFDIFLDETGKTYKTAGKIDYVAGWYYKAAKFIQGTDIKAAFLSTNSITQGEQVSFIFKPIHERFKIYVDFAYRPFVWDSEAPEKAQVHIVVVGFSWGKKSTMKRLYNSAGMRLCENINFYLIDCENIFVLSQKFTFRLDAPKMISGNRAADGGFLLINSPEELEELLRREPEAAKFIKRYMMGYEFINNIPRWCLWLVDAKPQELLEMPAIMERIKLCKEDRLKGAADRQKLAKTPWLFRETWNPKRYLAMPVTSSGLRSYIPIGWLDDSVIPGDALKIVPDATLYDFGVLTSRVHMGWMRVVSGRLKSDYSYSNTVVYNPFPWPSPTPKQKAKIEACAQRILDARALYPESSFAALYNDNIMPVELRKAHEANDAAVCEAYGWKRDIEEEELVRILLRQYKALRRSMGSIE